MINNVHVPEKLSTLADVQDMYQWFAYMRAQQPLELQASRILHGFKRLPITFTAS